MSANTCVCVIHVRVWGLRAINRNLTSSAVTRHFSILPPTSKVTAVTAELG